MTETCRETRLVEKHGQEARIAGDEITRHLEDDELVEAALSAQDGEKHIRHPTRAELGDQSIATDRRHELARSGIHRESETPRGRIPPRSTQRRLDAVRRAKPSAGV